MKVRDLIRGSLRLIGVLSTGESPSADEQADAFSSLNDLLESWSNQSLLVYDRPREEFPLVQGQQIYTMGTGGNFNTARPLSIEGVSYEDTSITPSIEIPIEIINLDEWQAITLKGTASSIPRKVYPDVSYPFVKLNVWPVPTLAKTLVIYSMKQITAFPSVDTDLSFPPGYGKALRYNLAVELAPEYGKQAPPDVTGIAAESKAEIKRINIKPSYLAVDDALVNRGKPFNWRTGD